MLHADGWGRISSATQSGNTKTYGWTPFHQLESILTSDTSGTDVDNDYTPGDFKRVERDEDGYPRQKYKHTEGTDVSVESYRTDPTNPATEFRRAYVPGLAEVDVTLITDGSPTTGDPVFTYLTTDHLGSTRAKYNDAKQRIGTWEYTPYGEPFNFAGKPGVTQLYTGHTWDSIAGVYYAPNRVYDPGLGRWLSREPLGMFDGPNMYGYVGGDPINFMDPNGLWGVKAFGLFIGVGEPTYDFDGADWGGYGGDVVDTAVGELKGAAAELSFGLYSPCYTSDLQRQGGAVGTGLAMIGGIIGTGGAGAAKGIGGRALRACNCFTGDVTVQTSEGLVPIEEVDVGDEVLSYDPETKTTEYKKVVHLFQREVDKILEIVIGDDAIRVTDDHPFYTIDGAIIEAGSLVPSMQVLGLNDIHLEIKSVESIDGLFTVYNFEVEDTHTYLVTEDGILVHNACEILSRFADGAESVSRLARKAAEAEASPLGIHGVSASAGARSGANHASRDAVAAHFRVHETGAPGHRTIELPKPVTQEVADLFNSLFGHK